MGKTYSYKKGRNIIIFYLIVVIIISFMLSKQLLTNFKSENIAYIFEDTIKKIPIELLVNANFVLSPNLEYMCATEVDQKTEEINRYTLFTNPFIPILTYLINTQIVSIDSMVEIYPYLSNYKATETQDEKFTLDDLHNTNPVQASAYTFEQLSNFDFMLNKIYTVDANIDAEKKLFDVKYFMESKQTIDMNKEGPKILIYHTHSQETFADSTPGDKGDTIVGVGDELAKILKEDYGIEVIHLRDEYDVINGKLDRSQAYERIEPKLKETLKKNPSIQVLIDVHRDGIPNNIKLVTEIDGKPTAKIMFFNGLSRIMKDGKMTNLSSMPNPYVKENMAFSFQMHLKANALYPGLTRKIYLKGYRYNLHLVPKSLLVEVGAQTNTVEEEKNAMKPLAKILCEVIE